MAEEVTGNSSTVLVHDQAGQSVSQLETGVSSTSTETSTAMEVSNDAQQTNLIDDAGLQSVISSMSETEMNAFLTELHKNGKAYLPPIGQTVEFLNVKTSSDNTSSMTTITNTHQSSDSALQELKSFIQQSPVDIMPISIEQKTNTQSIQLKSNVQTDMSNLKSSRTVGTHSGTTTRPGTAVKSTITSNTSGTAFRKSTQPQSFHDDRVFFGRLPSSTSTTIGPGQYHHRTGLIPQNRQHSMSTSATNLGLHRRFTTPNSIEQIQRRPISWFHNNRTRRHSSGDELDSDLDSSPPSYPIGMNDTVNGPRRRSTRVPKPKHDADFVTFPLLDRDEHGNPVGTTPYSVPISRTEDDEDDIPYRLMDSQRPTLSTQTALSSQINASTTIIAGRKARTVAELRASTLSVKKPARWPDDELYHVKSFSPLIMPQQITHPSTLKNKTTMCKPIVAEREIEAKPTRCTVETQTEIEDMIPDQPLITLPVPIYIPSPSPSYQLFKPKAVPIPVPFFVPIMIPVSKAVHKNIREFLQKQRDLLPDDPFQAALILHAESLVRAENHPQSTVSCPNQDTMMMMDTSRDDIIVLTSQTVQNLPELDLEAHYIDPITSNDPEIQKLLQMLPDANYRLKWTYGVQAFQQWSEKQILTSASLHHNGSELPNSKNYHIQSDLLTYNNADELQCTLEKFIREVRRPNGEIYLAESIFYLCLGIQFYLNINNRQIDLFDPCHCEFNSTLDNILQNYSPRILPESSVHVSLIDEELFYETQQFGTLSPYSLLNTVIYANSKYFNLKTVDAHLTISFANFGKYSQWVRLANGAPQGQQMNYLRFYAHNPDLKLLANSPTFYEITEEINDPLHCPIKHFDVYLSKCPEKIRGAADVFYLNPIASQSSDNPIWFSSAPLSPTVIGHILNRLKLIPSFYIQTKPVEIGAPTSLMSMSNSTNGNTN